MYECHLSARNSDILLPVYKEKVGKDTIYTLGRLINHKKLKRRKLVALAEDDIYIEYYVII